LLTGKRIFADRPCLTILLYRRNLPHELSGGDVCSHLFFPQFDHFSVVFDLPEKRATHIFSLNLRHHALHPTNEIIITVFTLQSEKAFVIADLSSRNIPESVGPNLHTTLHYLAPRRHFYPGGLFDATDQF
jgi:hypothetical protein